MDPTEWRDPEKFDPQRFLDKEGNIINTDRLVLFSMGEETMISKESMILCK